MSFITTNQYKLNKSKKEGWTTAGLNLSPADEARMVLSRSDLPTLCQNAGFCREVCLKKTGMNQMPTHILVRAARTAQLFDYWDATIVLVTKEIKRRVAKTDRFAFRPNLLSDLPKLAHDLAKQLPEVQFYDYTKLLKPHLRIKHNYHLTFSFSERTTWKEAEEILRTGINVAVVFNCLKDEPLPKYFRGWPVIDGDMPHDLRFLDPPYRVVGLHFKGGRSQMQKAIDAGFVVNPKLCNL